MVVALKDVFKILWEGATTLFSFSEEIPSMFVGTN